MKRVVLFILISVFSIPAYSAWYIVNIDNEVVATCEYMPDKADLDSRKEIAVWSDSKLSLSEAEYRGGKIVKHVKTAKELEKEAEQNKKFQEEKLIRQEMRAIAIERLKANGNKLDAVECESCTGGK